MTKYCYESNVNSNKDGKASVYLCSYCIGRMSFSGTVYGGLFLFEESEASHVSLKADVTFLPIVLLRKIIHIYCNAACIDPKDMTWKVCFEINWHLLEFMNSKEMDRSLLHLNFVIYGLHLWKATRDVCTRIQEVINASIREENLSFFSLKEATVHFFLKKSSFTQAVLDSYHLFLTFSA